MRPGDGSGAAGQSQGHFQPEGREPQSAQQAQGQQPQSQQQAQDEAMAFNRMMIEVFQASSSDHVLEVLNAVPYVGAVDKLLAYLGEHGRMDLDENSGLKPADLETIAGWFGVRFYPGDVRSLDNALRVASWIQSLRAANIVVTTRESLEIGPLAQTWNHDNEALRATFRAMFLAASLSDVIVNGLGHSGPAVGRPASQMAAQFIVGTLVRATLTDQEAKRYGVNVFLSAGEIPEEDASGLDPDDESDAAFDFMTPQAEFTLRQLVADGILIPLPDQDMSKVNSRYAEYTVAAELRPALLNVIDGLAQHLLPNRDQSQAIFGGGQ